MSAYVGFTRTKTIDQKRARNILGGNPSNDEFSRALIGAIAVKRKEESYD
jgi:hypothetical protein